MGFRVGINSNAEFIVNQMKGNPIEIFKEPFTGYLLFLFDHVSENNVLFSQWFEKHIEPLDALTGEEIAFAIFGNRFDFCLNIGGDISDRKPESKTVSIADLSPDCTITQLVKSGKCGWVVDGDEIRAVNKAVYDLAKEFGVLHKLPCIIVMDGLPDPNIPWICLPVSEYDSDFGGFYDHLRQAIGKLQNHPGLPRYWRQLNKLRVETKKRMELRAKMRVEGVNRQGPFPNWMNELRKALRKGDEGQLDDALGKFSKFHPSSTFQEEFKEKFLPSLQVFPRVLKELRVLFSKDCPLDDAEKRLLVQTCEESIREVIGTVASGSFNFRDNGKTLSRQVVDYRDQHIQTILAEFPTIQQWLEWERPERRERPLAQADLDIYNTSRAILSMDDRPSWSRIVSEELTQVNEIKIPEDLSFNQERAVSEGFLDWIDLPEVMSYLRKMDFFGLQQTFNRIGKLFGQAVISHSPKAFASYANSDRPEVLRRIQGMRAFQPKLDVFVDFHSLYPGDEWKSRLKEEIDSRDRFFLFWSEAASQSRFVAEEYRHALNCGKSITPVPLCSPDEVPPPRELEHLHFNDLYVEYLRYATLL